MHRWACRCISFLLGRWARGRLWSGLIGCTAHRLETLICRCWCGGVALALVVLGVGGLDEVQAEGANLVAHGHAASVEEVDSVDCFDRDDIAGVGFGGEVFWTAHPHRDWC